MTIFDDIKQDIINDPYNKDYTDRGIEPVFYASENAKIAIIGQAPGKKVEETGIFWNDKSGDRLREWMGVDRDTFYQTDLIAQLPMDFYYPGKAKTGDKPPRKEFADKFHPQILENMPNLETIILIGNYSQKHYLGKDRHKNLTETVRNYQDYMPDYFPLVHPSPLNQRWIAKNPWFETDVLPDFKQLIQAYLGDVEPVDETSEVDDYIERQEAKVQTILNKLRQELAEALPDCREKIAYDMPTLFDNKTVIHYGANKAHLGIYPFPKTIDAFEDKVGQYRSAKGTLHFPYDAEIPYDLIVELAVYNYQQQK